MFPMQAVVIKAKEPHHLKDLQLSQAVENEGVAPDVDVENWPKDVIAGHDPQLEKAVEEAMKMLKAKPVQRMDKEPPSPTWGNRKP